jgi:hypothetical protein
MRTRIPPDADERAHQESPIVRTRPRVRVAVGLVLLLALASPHALRGQEVGLGTGAGQTLVELTLVDGSTLVGTILETRPDGTIRFRSLGGVELTVEPAGIARRSVARGRVVDGVFWRDDPNPSRLMFTSTGRAIPRGEGYVGSFVLVIIPVPFVAYGVTDRITVAASTPVFPGAMGEALLLAPKVHLLSAERVELAAGTLLVLSRESPPLSLTYGVGTFGDLDRALTVGFGIGVDPEGGAWDQAQGRYGRSTSPIGMIGGEVRLSPRTKFVTENWFLGGGLNAILGGGIRIVSESMSADLGLGAIVGEDFSGCCLPMVNFVVPFGGGR